MCYVAPLDCITNNKPILVVNTGPYLRSTELSVASVQVTRVQEVADLKRAVCKFDISATDRMRPAIRLICESVKETFRLERGDNEMLSVVAKALKRTLTGGRFMSVLIIVIMIIVFCSFAFLHILEWSHVDAKAFQQRKHFLASDVDNDLSGYGIANSAPNY